MNIDIPKDTLDELKKISSKENNLKTSKEMLDNLSKKTGVKIRRTPFFKACAKCGEPTLRNICDECRRKQNEA